MSREVTRAARAGDMREVYGAMRASRVRLAAAAQPRARCRLMPFVRPPAVVATCAMIGYARAARDNDAARPQRARASTYECAMRKMLL